MNYVSLCIAILAALFARWQAFESHRVISVTERSVVVAERSAIAIEQSLTLLKLEQRAIFRPINYNVTRHENGNITFLVSFDNIGKSEAIEIQGDVSLKLDRQEIKKVNTLTTVSPEWNTTMARNPGEGIGFAVEGTLTLDQWRDIDAKKSKLAVVCIVSHKNVFDSERTSKGWCFEYQPGEKTNYALCPVK